MALIDAIVWDWGRVLGKFDHSIMWRNLSGYGRSSPEKLKEILTPISALHETGRITSREFYQKACAVGLKFSYDGFRAAWASCVCGENSEIIALLRRVWPGIRQCVLSNTDPLHWEAIERQSLMREFFSNPHQLVRSFDQGVNALKPDRAMYDAAMRRANTLPERLLYVDDIVAYCDAAALLGIRVFNYDCTTQPVAPLEEVLTRLDAVR